MDIVMVSQKLTIWNNVLQISQILDRLNKKLKTVLLIDICKVDLNIKNHLNNTNNKKASRKNENPIQYVLSRNI